MAIESEKKKRKTGRKSNRRMEKDDNTRTQITLVDE